jgi:hypothetical protein
LNPNYTKKVARGLSNQPALVKNVASPSRVSQ